MKLELGKANTLLCAKVRVSTNGTLLCPKSKINQFPRPCERYKAGAGGWRVKELQFPCRWLSVALGYRAVLPTEPWISAGDCSLKGPALDRARNRPGFWGGWCERREAFQRKSLCPFVLWKDKKGGEGADLPGWEECKSRLWCFLEVSQAPSLCALPQSPPAPVTPPEVQPLPLPLSQGQLCNLCVQHRPGCWSHTAVPPADLEGNRGKSRAWSEKSGKWLCTNKIIVSS